MHRGKAKVVRQWLSFVDDRVQQRVMMIRMVSRWTTDKLHKGWNAWRSFVVVLNGEEERERDQRGGQAVVPHRPLGSGGRARVCLVPCAGV